MNSSQAKLSPLNRYLTSTSPQHLPLPQHYWTVCCTLLHYADRSRPSSTRIRRRLYIRPGLEAPKPSEYAPSFRIILPRLSLTQFFPSIACAEDCVEIANTGDCSATDEQCLCSSSVFVDSVQSCIEVTCFSSDIQTAFQAIDNVCTAA